MKTPAEGIIRVVAEYYEWEPKLLLGRSRVRPISDARFMAMWLTKKKFNYSWRAVGMAFGRDHGTAIHACKKINNWIETIPKIRRDSEILWERLRDN